jgi:hypothetical protein
LGQWEATDGESLFRVGSLAVETKDQ